MLHPVNVSIIIVNYNTSKLVSSCIDSIIEHTKDVEYEILVVDNDSSEDTSQLKSCSSIKYIQSDTNLGFGKANNLGAQYANGKYLFFLNPDTCLINNAIKILYDSILSDKEIGICGGNLYTKDLTPNHSYQLWFPGILPELTETIIKVLYIRKPDFNYTDSEKDVAYITGADLMIEKDIFLKIGGFDKDFFMYFEETYLCYMVKKAGYRIVNIPKAKIIHLEGHSFELKTRREDLFHLSRKLFFKKIHKSGIYYTAFRVAFLINNFIKLLLFTITSNDKKNIILYRIKQMING